MDIITYSDAVHHKNKYRQEKRRKIAFSHIETVRLYSAINPQKILFGSSVKPETAKKTGLSSREESFIFLSLLTMLILGVIFFYFPILKLNWGFSSIKPISFWDEPSSINAMRQYVMPSADISKGENYAAQTDAGEKNSFSPADVPDFITAVDFEEYMVSKGDTVSGLIQKFGLKNPGTLLSVNGISSVKKLKIGQKLVIPSIDGIIYTAVKGDSLSSIAQKFNLSINAVLDANDLENQSINIGQKLFIPGATMSTFELRKALGELFIYPINGRLTSPFGYRRDPFTGRKSFHTGIDIASPTGTPIKLTLDGKVSYTGYSAIYGNYVIVTHSGGYQSMYGHMHTIKVKRGQILNQGAVIGTVGNTGRSTGPHVHFSIYKNGKLINPLTVLK
ncbi:MULTISPECIES: peptidoglycan DD-metalloendopeptidase family protein [unclassified Treponema]|uniref:peptidoglycan DD-metalloendopeptidase family protein n=1 Tax=unclassified Treponema TaxID=2638727 RepID=UPI0020A3B4B3|nr:MULTISPECIES: peptidoglycan DD-metalloendopeptidase family protein [unclassified Treponema]UTC66473.1 M23 family metallopeptidase [Treponema sp. OMZ 789]UTC69205.1 M23 family metallopeptidase [Treponema sp. OMZ 790]UTC71918.1 M23 family metallopeptidase [Treponema sp. OMZ 791]